MLLVSAHLCNWEWMAIGMSLRTEQPLSVIIKNQTGKLAERFLNKMRTRFGNKMLNAGDVRGIIRALRNGEWLAILADQAPPSTSVRVPFFGRSVPSYEGPARLALQTRAPLFFVDCISEASTYHMRVREISFDDLTEFTDDNVRELTYRHVHMLEECIRANPSRWLWQHRRWKNAENE